MYLTELRSHKKKRKKKKKTEKKGVRLLPLPLIVHYEIHGQPNYIPPLHSRKEENGTKHKLCTPTCMSFYKGKFSYLRLPTPTYGGGVSAGIMVVMSSFHCINGFDERL